MAAGDITFYTKYLLGLKDQSDSGLSSLPVDLDTDTIKVIVLTDTHSPDTSGTSTQEHLDDISANEVATATAYTGPITLAGSAVTESANVVTWDANDITIAADGSGFSNARWIVFYKDSGTAATSPLIASGDLGSNRTNVGQTLTFEWNATGISTLS